MKGKVFDPITFLEEKKEDDEFFVTLKDYFPFIRWVVMGNKGGWIVIENEAFKFIPYPSEDITPEEFITLLNLERL